MYFKNRAEAGRKIAAKLERFKTKSCTIIALSEGAVIIGAQISMKLHAPLTILLTERIMIPGEPDPLGEMSSSGMLTYNNMFSAGQLEEFTSEFYQYIEEQKIEKFHHLNQLIGHGGEIDHKLLKNHYVILVSDGLSSGLSLDVARDFLKSIPIKRLIVATPIASVQAVDKMHLVGDEICCLSVPQNYLATNHYYDDNTIPDHEGLMKLISNNSMIWAEHPVASKH